MDWKAEHEAFLNDVLGYEDAPQYRFLAGILFAPSSSKNMVPLLQDVIQANGADTSFGKYTLLSTYGNTANGNMAPLAFGIMFGNEDTGIWTKFWEFVKEIHPSVNAPTITILTFQDKGLIAAISKTLPEAHQFHCSYHRCQNIIKACRGAWENSSHSSIYVQPTLWIKFFVTASCHQREILSSDASH